MIDGCVAGDVETEQCVEALAKYLPEDDIVYVHDDLKSLIKNRIIDFLFAQESHLNIFPTPSNIVKGMVNHAVRSRQQSAIIHVFC